MRQRTKPLLCINLVKFPLSPRFGSMHQAMLNIWDRSPAIANPYVYPFGDIDPVMPRSSMYIADAR
jgi:hypothetical protein